MLGLYNNISGKVDSGRTAAQPGDGVVVHDRDGDTGAEGKTTREIAATLYVSVKTVETHRKQIMDKLGLSSIAELTKYAIREGLTSVE